MESAQSVIGNLRMTKYRKRPIVVEATQWKGASDEAARALGLFYQDGRLMKVTKGWFIETLEGPLHVSLNDWIITGVKGEKYPCKPDVFEATYEIVE